MFSAFLLAGCSGSSGPPVELVVPKGFTGTVWLMLDPDGQDISLVNGRYQIVVPAGGVLRVRSFRPLEQWHSFSARYDDGTPIPWEHSSDARVAPDAVAVRGAESGVRHRGGREYRYNTFFVGTAKQRSELPDTPEIPGAARPDRGRHAGFSGLSAPS